MKKNEPITNIMSTNLSVVQDGQPISEVRMHMVKKKIHHVPILSGKRLVGLISSNDLIKLNIVISGADDRTVNSIIDSQFTVEDVMETQLTTLNAKSTIREAAVILSEGLFHSIPVVDERDELIGIVTSSDLIRYLSQQYQLADK